MKKAKLRILALFLAASMLLTGCGVVDFGGYFQQLKNFLGINQIVAYADMEYSKPDMRTLEDSLDTICRLAEEGSDLDAVVEAILNYYEEYDKFYTAYALSFIRYSGDVTDSYWEDAYNFCADRCSEVDAGLDNLYYTLAESPLREDLEGDDYFGEGFFDDYQGDSMWDDVFTALMEKESELESRYYDLYTQSLEVEDYTDAYFTEYGSQMGDLFVEMIALRQEIAAYAGYDSYPEFAYDFYHYRDYTPDQGLEYLNQIQEELVPLYQQMRWDMRVGSCDEDETFAYVKNCAETMGGTVASAFQLLEEGGLYDIAYGRNKYNSSFEIFLSSYYEPFIFMNPRMDDFDRLTLSHEFGHFVNDYACGGTSAGIDVAEFFSQGMEYLSLCYGKDTEDLEKLKMADCLSTYVEQAAYASFEHQVYGLTGEDLTAENVYTLYAQIGQDFGFDSWGWDSRDFVRIPHFFTQPMYVISYVVSNDAALQLYQIEKETPGEGLALYQDNLTSGETYFLAFVEAAGLESPFAEGRIQAVRETLETILG